MFATVFCHSIREKLSQYSPSEVNCDVCLLSVSANAGELPEPDGEAGHGRSSQLERDRCSPDSDLSVEQENRDVFSDY